MDPKNDVDFIVLPMYKGSNEILEVMAIMEELKKDMPVEREP
jgi:citrate lyase beta subunit